MVNKIFKHQIGRNIDMYMDDMIVKDIFLITDSHLVDLVKIF